LNKIFLLAYILILSLLVSGISGCSDSSSGDDDDNNLEEYEIAIEVGLPAQTGQFFSPYGIAVDSSGYIYVADTDNHCILKYYSNGNFLAKIGLYGTPAGNYLQTIDCYQTSRISHLVIDNNNFIYLISINPKILKFDSNNNLLADIWESYLYLPEGIAVDNNQSIYVANSGNHNILKLSLSN
jgi:tripartite motif-containing protein 71